MAFRQFKTVIRQFIGYKDQSSC